MKFYFIYLFFGINSECILQASPLGHTTSSSSFVHPQQLAQLSEHPRQSFIYTPPESGRQPLGIPPAQSRPRGDQERRPGENGGVPRGPGQPSAEGPKMVRGGGAGIKYCKSRIFCVWNILCDNFRTFGQMTLYCFIVATIVLYYP